MKTCTFEIFRLFIGAVFTVLFGLSPLYGEARWYMDTDQPFGQDWTVVSYWNACMDGSGIAATAMTASDTYYINGKILRTQQQPTGVGTFPGGTLVVDSGQLYLKSGTSIVTNLIATGGTILSAAAPGTDARNQTVQVGTFTIEDSVTLSCGILNDGRSLTSVFTTLAGAGDLIISGSATNVFYLSVTDAASYTGAIHVAGAATLNFQNDLLTGGALVIDSTAKVKLDQNVTFKSVTVSGTSLAPGTYSYSTLHSSFPSIFGASTAGSITVLPSVAWTPADLGDRVWLDWWAEDLPDGAVSTWISRNGSVVATGSAGYLPTKQNGEVLFASGTSQQLTFPKQSCAHRAHRAIMLLFRIDLACVANNGSIFAVNGVGGGYENQPSIKYNASTNKVSVIWATPGHANSLDFTVSENANQWHCLVSRRIGNTHYASIDGRQIDGVTPGESSVVMSAWAIPKVNSNVIGYIGDNRTYPSPAMALDTVVIVQDELQLDEAQKLMGWGMWRRGIQSQLPADHPYRNQAPASTPPSYVFRESTAAQWADLTAFWEDSARARAYRGSLVNVDGWNLVFQDEFDQHTVTNQVEGTGNWFAPVHESPCGAAVGVVPPVNTTNPALGTEGTPATYIQSNSTMTIRMQNSGGWKSGCFCSVNTNGYGRTWMYPYIEARMKTGPSSTGSLKGSWPALWVRSQNYFFNLCESTLEFDCYEGYISDVTYGGLHTALHNWPATRVVPDRLAVHRCEGNYQTIKTANGFPQDVNLFDNQYHTYGVMVRPDYVITMFDGREVFRFPTPIEMKQPLWILVDLAMLPQEAAMADGTYDLTIDYIRVYQNPAYPQ